MTSWVWNRYVGKAVPAKYKPKGAVRYCDPDAERNSATSRFTDNPFRDPDATPEQLEWIRKRNEATRIFRETGDRTMAVEIGLFAPDPLDSKSVVSADDPDIQEVLEGAYRIQAEQQRRCPYRSRSGLQQGGVDDDDQAVPQLEITKFQNSTLGP